MSGDDIDEALKDPRLRDAAIKLAGELVLSREPGRLMKHWREKVGIQQIGLAKEMGISPSVLSDYEGGRRKSPGSQFIRKYVAALIRVDRDRDLLLGSKGADENPDAILSIGEFREPRSVSDIARILSLEVLTGEEQLGRMIYGYTVLDSIKAIYALSGNEFYRIYGSTTERVLVFTRVVMGRSPMVAVRVSQLKPRMVVVHGPERVDPLSVDLARRERIVMALARIGVREIVDKLSSL
ncbi:MAG: helix-turn-helix domain-containing protein [Conexivisphaera sp.]